MPSLAGVAVAAALHWLTRAELPHPSDGRADGAPVEPQAVELQWRAPSHCPDGAAVRDEIARFVADGGQTGAIDRVRVDAEITVLAGRHVLELELQLASGVLRKRIEADDCAVLASAAALVMAVMLDPAAVVETVDAGPRPANEPPPELRAVAPAAPPPPPVSSVAARRRRPVQGFARVVGMGTFGAMPSFGGALGSALGVRIGRARILATAVGELPQRVRDDVESGAGARMDLWALGAHGCFAPAVATVEFPLCLGVEAGQIRGRGFGLRTPRRTAAPWLAVPLGVGVWWAPAPRIAVGGGVDGWVAATRPAFAIDDLGPLHRPGRLGLRIHAGVELRLP